MVLLFLAVFFSGYCQAKYPFRLMQFNIWQEGTMIPGGFDCIVNEIIAHNPDVVTFSEVRNYYGSDCMARIVAALEEKGYPYYAESSVSTGILSRHKILSQSVVYPLKNDRGSVIKARIKVQDKSITIYSAHLDWLDYACYLPRGYDGRNWKKIVQPVTDVDQVIEANDRSFRDEEVALLIADAKEEMAAGQWVVVGGDFNEPSHLDWTARTANIRDHQGLIVPWTCSLLLEKAGFKDAFRVKYPDPVNHPGFTFPANNINAPLSRLAWASEADERDRIDYIYYFPLHDVLLKSVRIVGPEGSVINGKRTWKDFDSRDRIFSPVGIWPSDHKAIIATFLLK